MCPSISPRLIAVVVLCLRNGAAFQSQLMTSPLFPPRINHGWKESSVLSSTPAHMQRGGKGSLNRVCLRMTTPPSLQEENVIKGSNGAISPSPLSEEAEIEENRPSTSSSTATANPTTISTSTGGITLTTSSSSSSRQLPANWLFEKSYILFTAILIGLFTGTNIAVFKTGVEFLREALYGDGLNLKRLAIERASETHPLVLLDDWGATIPQSVLNLSENIPISCIPIIGGLIVGMLLKFGGEMPPGLRDTVKEVDLDSMRASNINPPDELLTCTKNIPPPDERNDVARFLRKALAATATLGTGNSLGPEGPSVEAGMSFSRILINNEGVFGTLEDYGMSDVKRANRKIARDRLLLACGAAAGVSAGFNAPLSGVFFALEIVQNALVSIELPVTKEENAQLKVEASAELQTATVGGEALALEQINISALLLSSVVSALTIQLLLGNELALRLGEFEFNNALLELPLYLVLGGLAGLTAALFSGVAQFSKMVFDGDAGPDIIRQTFTSIPSYQKPFIGSVVCGIVGIFIPQILFFGYETLNGLFLNNNIPTEYLFVLLLAKLSTTAICAASGLVGGTFAPSLFLGGVLGAGFHNIANELLQSVPDFATYQLSGLPAFAMVGAASVLAALFRAPLTASLLLFECTRNYDVILPLMASAGVASLTGDLVEKWLEEEQRENDPVSWGDLATRIYGESEDDICIPPEDR